MEELPVRLKTWKSEMETKVVSEHEEDKDHSLWPQSEPSEKNLERKPVTSVRQV